MLFRSPPSPPINPISLVPDAVVDAICSLVRDEGGSIPGSFISMLPGYTSNRDQIRDKIKAAGGLAQIERWSRSEERRVGKGCRSRGAQYH